MNELQEQREFLLASLRDLEGHILTQAPHMASAPSSSIEGNLAPAITTFVGREDDVAALVFEAV